MLMKGIFCLILVTLLSSNLFAQKIIYQVDSATRSISKLAIDNYHNGMNWILSTSGKQYSWVMEKYGWGLGYFTKSVGNKSIKQSWMYPVSTDNDEIVYRVDNIEIKVIRQQKNNDLIERYLFTNLGNTAVLLSEVGIYTPFNDNYPDSETCVNERVNTHIWAGGNASYVNAMHMGGKNPNIGLVTLKGSIDGYEISERGMQKGWSNFRGVISLVSSRMALSAGETKEISWNIFSHNGSEDFYKQLLNRGVSYVTCDKYVVEQGNSVHAMFHSDRNYDKVWVKCGNVQQECRRVKNGWKVNLQLTTLGENKLEFLYGNAEKTIANCLVVSGEKELIEKRASFIINHQQMMNPNDLRYGAYMVYDCEDDKIFLNDIETASYPDRDEGAERLGMGVFLAKQYLLGKDEKIKNSLMEYAAFVRTQLQDKHFNTWSSVDKQGRNRAYNYPWVASFYFYMYKVTNNKLYLTYGYETMQAMFRHFGYGFYAIDIPVKLSLELLKEAGLQKEYAKLKADYLMVGEEYLKNSTLYPKHEVNYEQSIVAPAVMVLSQLYLETKDKRFLNEVKKQMPLLNAFAGFQPSFHLNDISIRHWDGYWFGKREMWGDVFPHYWSTLSAAAYHYYYLCTGDKTYQKRAENIVRNNLCLFFENGEASCAYIYPNKVNGIEGKFYDPFANDQDWALVYYFLVNRNL